MIQPTIGRKLYFKPTLFQINEMRATYLDLSQPFDATIVFVHEDATINIAGYDHNGVGYKALNIPLIQDGDEPPEDESYAYWMPYQVQQAKQQ
jgi:hypothetical protein